jgi:aryl-alcohol dehydrogenase-like predicted oxidoreductase
MTLAIRPYGATGMAISVLGLGTIPLGDRRLTDREADALLDEALAAGITLIDTAPSYGAAEQRLGRWLRGRRDALVISTKLGYAVPGIADWTGPCIAAGVDLALQRLRTDRLDIAHLHSCPLATLCRDDVLSALEAAKQAGKVRAIAYSGDGEALDYALQSGRFDGLMASFNLFDQRVSTEVLPRLGSMGFIAKRPLANAPWRFTAQPIGDYSEVYWQRWQAMNLADPGMPWAELALRFAIWHQGVSGVVVGSAQPEHLRQCVAWAQRGALPEDTLAELRACFERCDRGWVGQV